MKIWTSFQNTLKKFTRTPHETFQFVQHIKYLFKPIFSLAKSCPAVEVELDVEMHFSPAKVIGPPLVHTQLSHSSLSVT